MTKMLRSVLVLLVPQRSVIKGKTNILFKQRYFLIFRLLISKHQLSVRNVGAVGSYSIVVEQENILPSS